MSMAGVGPGYSLPAACLCPQAAVCRRPHPLLHSPALPCPALLPSLLGICCSCSAAHSLFWASQRVVPLIQRKSQMTKIKYCCNVACNNNNKACRRTMYAINSAADRADWRSLCHVHIPYSWASFSTRFSISCTFVCLCLCFCFACS